MFIILVPLPSIHFSKMLSWDKSFTFFQEEETLKYLINALVHRCICAIPKPCIIDLVMLCHVILRFIINIKLG